MFAQGQLLGMQSDLLMRLKTEINAWDKVAERHPYSVYRRREMPTYSKARESDPFTTSFGEGLPFRTYDRNARARSAVGSTRTMEQPYPPGYTGHVAKVRHVVGRTYGRQVRDAINSVTPAVELAVYTPHVESVNPSGGIPSAAPPSVATVSTQQLAYTHPDAEVVAAQQRAADAVSTRKPVDHSSRYASSALLSYPPPPPRCYATPGWSERPTSNIGQPDTFKHARKCTVHTATLPRRIAATGATMDAYARPAVSRPSTSSAATRTRPTSDAGSMGTITMHSKEAP